MGHPTAYQNGLKGTLVGPNVTAELDPDNVTLEVNGSGKAAVKGGAFDTAGAAATAQANAIATAATDATTKANAAQAAAIAASDASGAAATAQAYAIQRSHHTGTQLLATISDAGGAAALNVGTGAGTVAAGNDARLSDARTPTAHASTHLAVGSDPVWGLVPIGGVVPWHKSYGSTLTPALPTEWRECNGQQVTDAASPYYLQNLPDLNGNSGNQMFIRGKTVSGGTGGSASHSHQVTISLTSSISSQSVQSGSGASVLNNVSVSPFGNPFNTTSISNLPPYFEMVYVMRIK